MKYFDEITSFVEKIIYGETENVPAEHTAAEQIMKITESEVLRRDYQVR